jgi:hypothetical protein
LSIDTVDQALARARRALDTPTLYWLGEGGWAGRQPALDTPGRPFDPAAALRTLATKDPAKHAAYSAGLGRLGLGVDALPRLACDCSGFVAWCLGVPRHPIALAGQADAWFYTDAIHADALGPRQAFTALDRAEVGALLVFPSAGRARPVGHIAWITEVADGRPTRLLHCAPQNFEAQPPPGRPRNAIAETGTAVFEGEVARDVRVVAWKAFDAH